MIENSDIKYNEEISNKGFDELHNKFIQYNWKLTRNTKTEIIYENSKTDDEFIIRILEKTIDKGGPIDRVRINLRRASLNEPFLK